MTDEEPKKKSWLDELLWKDEQPADEPATEVAGDEGDPGSPPRASQSPLPAAPAAATASDRDGLDLAAIYRSAGIEDQQFATPEQVLELKATFADLPAEAQRQKVLKTLASFKVDVSRVAHNTQRKIDAIEAYVQGIRSEGAATIDTSNQTIEEMQKQMDACKTRILETQRLLDSVSRGGQEAVTRLKGALDFIGVAAPPPEVTPPGKAKPAKSK